MKHIKFLIIGILPFFAFATVHKYYVSVTEIEYVQEKKSVQIISRFFIDDFENALRTRYDESIVLSSKAEPKSATLYIERYLDEKFKIKINGEGVPFEFVGKAYERGLIICYFEVVNVESISSFEVSNTILFDVFKEQQNIIKIKINSKQKNYILIPQKDKALLKFN
ncbi:DUF6702 family protein [Mariniflexile ostreae]|uniref:DUF6702 family protein n=1 Tax=Mariniflexile ostreae TaxID=1520892 RepID=A0ABV5FER1_9FLAO